MLKINFADPLINNFEKKELINAFNSKWISIGPYNQKLEDAFSAASFEPFLSSYYRIN